VGDAMARGTRRFFFADVVAVLVLSTMADGAVLTPNHESSAQQLLQKSAQINQDIVSIQKSAIGNNKLYECLDDFRESIENVHLRFRIVSTLIFLSRAMRNQDDELTILAELKTDLSFFPKDIDNQRALVNLTLGHCASYGVVAVKGNDLLNFYSSLVSFTRSIARSL
jgi:hypothetical protein